MVIAKLMGGLGNQMFQYAAGRALASQLNTDLMLDASFLLDRTPRPNFVYRDYDLSIFRLKVPFATDQQIAPFLKQPSGRLESVTMRLKNWVSPHIHYKEPHFHFDEKFFKLTGNVYMEGYWQSPRYFEPIEAQIRSDFQFAIPIPTETQSLMQQIQSTEAVCVNVRRTDFLTNKFHGVCDMRYYMPAIDYMIEKLNDPHFFVFSDDPAWCIENFKFPYPFTFVGHEHAGEKFSSYLQLMAACSHFIIPNSSFAWWAVWFRKSIEKIVIAPKIWFTDVRWNPRDLIPAQWIRVEN
jgi:hypothetical protein